MIYIEKNGEVIFSVPCLVESENANSVFAHLTAKDIYDFSLSVDLDKIRFIQEAAKLNSALSQEGLRTDYGLHIGRTLKKDYAPITVYISAERYKNRLARA